MITTKLRTIVLAGLVTTMAAGTAHAQIVGQSSDSNKANVGASSVNGGPHVSGRPGIGVPSTGLTTRVDFQGLQACSPAGTDGVRVLNMPSSAPTDHSSYGAFRFAKVGAADVDWLYSFRRSAAAIRLDHAF